MGEETRRAGMTPEEQIEKFWLALERGWDIEPRSYFEEQAPRNGFGSPLAMAAHYMWKRGTKCLCGDATALSAAEARGAAAERARCIDDIQGERLTDETGEKADEAYNTALDHAVGAIRARARSHKGSEGEAADD